MDVSIRTGARPETVKSTPTFMTKVSSHADKIEEDKSKLTSQIGEQTLQTKIERSSSKKSIVAKELKEEIESRKLKKITKTSEVLGSTKESTDSSISIDLKSHRLGTSSNPVALLKQDRFIPTFLLEKGLDENVSSDVKNVLEQAPKLFDKEEVINNLHLLLSPEDEQVISEEKAAKIISIIRHLTQESGQFVHLDEIILESFPDLKQNLPSYVKLSDVRSNEQMNGVAKKVMKEDLTLPSHQRMISIPEEVVYKGGLENIREDLATQKAALEGYEDILHLKESVSQHSGLVLKWGESPLMHPLKSDFLEGYQHISRDDWNAWGKARQEFDLASFLVDQAKETKDEVALKEAEHKLAHAVENLEITREKILFYDVDPTSVCKLAFYETKINANDFHTEQFMIGQDPNDKNKKRMISIDEGRWGPPGIAYPYGGSIAITLKNSLLTHPNCLNPIPEEFRAFLKQRLSEIDMKTRKMKETGLVWSKKEFEELEETYKTTIEALSTFSRAGKVADANVPSWAKKFDISYDENTSVGELRNKVLNHLRSKVTELKEKSFAKQSEQSLDQEVEREKRMIEYIINNEKATIYEAFEVGYPELASFMKVMRRMHNDPGKVLAYNDKGFVAPRSLNSFIQEVKKQKIASKEEIIQMEKDLETLKNQHTVSTHTIALTSNAF